MSQLIKHGVLWWTGLGCYMDRPGFETSVASVDLWIGIPCLHKFGS